MEKKNIKACFASGEDAMQVQVQGRGIKFADCESCEPTNQTMNWISIIVTKKKLIGDNNLTAEGIIRSHQSHLSYYIKKLLHQKNLHQKGLTISV